ncbi:sensor histidine kinase [Glaciecola petra]|uniref:histidine kinase n=1 Tax=Glaciecola petra TaxID=3075602 RepID=A0ABU2ZMF1_9ALTE|nr:ATP-binding protein [Aestuariibacter sp. P117]MDT0593806.1 ATP-binding protein [Aestuariibacter sp. P117]
MILSSSPKQTAPSLSKSELSANVVGDFAYDDTFNNGRPIYLNSSDIDNDSRFFHLISVLPAGVLVVDKMGRVSLANQQAIHLLGEPLKGNLWRDVINRVFAPQADDGHEVSMRNGKRVKIDICPLSIEKGQLIVITDLTETRQLQSRVGHMQRLSSLGKMVASLAHQVRTPLSSALLYAENLKSMSLRDDLANRFSEKLTHRLKELESQVNDMLLFAKSSDQQIVSTLLTQDIQDKSIAQVDAQLKQENITLTVSNEIVDSAILGNLTAICGAIANLLMNASHAMAETSSKKPHIQLLTRKANIKNVDYAVISVIDNGPGLEQDKINKLFEPFFTTKSQGTGLGLSVVNTVAKSHKGFVKCGNNEIEGAYFSLYLPLSNSNISNTQKNSETGVAHE